MHPSFWEIVRVMCVRELLRDAFKGPGNSTFREFRNLLLGERMKLLQELFRLQCWYILGNRGQLQWSLALGSELAQILAL